ncbi:Crp/Fnr family transcriptional regulator [Sphingomonas crocodyli]|nr:Crp/Fnr family transcriptional regulator [Sphingomonas crocodyli]
MSLATPSIDLYVARLASRSNLSDEELDALQKLPTRAVRKKAGTSFTICGEKVSGVWIVSSGLVSGFQQLRSGLRQITALHIEGDMADQPSAKLGLATTGLEALTDVTLLHISRTALQSVQSSFPAVAGAMAVDAAVDAAIQIQWSTNAGRKCSRSRLAHFFCEMAARYEYIGQGVGFSFDLPMTQFHLADAMAITPVHVNRVLMALRAEGIVEMRHRRVFVLDWEALIRLGEFSPFYLHHRKSHQALNA